MFSYDTTIFQSGKGTQCLLSSERKPIYDGLSSSKLTINPVKHEATCFVRGKPEKFKIGYAELNHRTSCKHLGVLLEKKLIFLEYIDYILKKLNKVVRPPHLQHSSFLSWKRSYDVL